MAFLRSSLPYAFEPEVHSGRVMLRLPQASDYAAWAELRAASRAHLEPFEPRWSSDELTRTAYRRRLRRYVHDVREDLGYPFFIFRQSDGVLIGGVTLSNVRRGVSQAASLGYWIGARFAGQGLMTEAVSGVVRMAFGELRLNRVEAACLPHNRPSMRVLGKCGFRHEGRGRNYLCIAGVWQDHELFALLADDVASVVGPS